MKKTIMAILVAVGTGTSVFCTENQKANIFVEYSPQAVDIKKMSEVLIVSPKNAQTVLEFTTSSGDESHFLFIGQSDKAPSPLPQSVKNSQMQQLVLQNPYQMKVHTDFTALDPFVSTQTYHDIHNDGYHIAANKQTYKDSTFAFANNGAVQLNPQSPMFQLQQNNSQNPLLALLGNLAVNHLSGSQANKVHRSSVKPGCFVKGITARPYEATPRESSINGTISYGEAFDMELSVSSMVLEFKPNDGFQFNLQG